MAPEGEAKVVQKLLFSMLINSNDKTTEIINLFGYTGEQHRGKTFYFPNICKPSLGDQSWKALWNEIRTTARNSNGAELCITGTSATRGHQIGCEMHRPHRQHDNNKKEFNSDLGFDFAINLKSKSLVNDRKNQRPGGQMMAKTTRTRAPTDPSKVCKLRLTIYEDLDADMFCIKGGLGTCYHQHHEPRNVGKHRVRSTDLSPEIQKMVCDLKEPNCSSTQVRQCVKSQTGLTLPNHQIIHLQNKLKIKCTGPAKTAAKCLIQTLTKQDGVDFVLLFHKSSSANSTASHQDKHLSNPKGCPKKDPVLQWPNEV